MTRSPVLPGGRRWQAMTLALLVLCGPPGAAQEPSPPAQAEAAATFARQALLPASHEHELRYAWALALARRGDLESSGAELEALCAQPLDDELAGHVASELERVRRFEALRARHLAALAEREGTLRLELEGRLLTFHVQTLETDRVVFKSSVFGVSSLPLARIDSLQVAKQMARDLDGDAGLWLRLYPYLLYDEVRGFQLLRRDCRGLAEAAPLLEDAQHWYPRVLDLVDAADQLEELATATGGDEGEEVTLEGVRRLLAEHGDLAVVRRRLGELRGLAAACLQGSFSTKDLLAQLHGRRKRLEDGSLCLVYEFGDAEELEDFRPAPGYPPERVAVLPVLGVPAGAGRFELDGGDLVVAGSRSWKHVQPLRGPVVVRCRLRVEPGPAGAGTSCFWMLGACDDGQESYVALQELGTAMAVDRSRGFVVYEPAGSSRRLALDVAYDLELACDGETVRTRVDGELVKEIPAGGLRGGEVFFLVHSDATVRIERIELVVAPGGLAENGGWIDARLAELGLPPALHPAPEGETGVQ